jgi:hypothetical protein
MILIHGDDSHIDVCDECKYAVLELLNRPPPELGASPIAPPNGEAHTKAPKGAFSFLGIGK